MDPYRNLKGILGRDKSLGFLDTETMLERADVYGPGKQYVSPKQMDPTLPARIMTIQYTFPGDKDITVLHWNEKKRCDKEMLQYFTEEIAPIPKVWVAQNGDNFDFPKLQTRLCIEQFTPLSNFITLDMLKLSRSAFNYGSHSLDYRLNAHGLGRKIKTDMDLWKRCRDAIPGALEELIRYGAWDVDGMEQLFWLELPYYRNLPVSLAQLIYPEQPKAARQYCPRCADKRQRKFDIYPTKVDNKLRYKCNNCNHIWRDNRKMNVGH